MRAPEQGSDFPQLAAAQRNRHSAMQNDTTKRSAGGSAMVFWGHKRLKDSGKRPVRSASGRFNAGHLAREKIFRLTAD
jgi:hypothetical protein